MPRPIAFDVTHAVSRLGVDTPTGIDKVDLAYVHHFAVHPCATLVHYGLRAPRAHAGGAIQPLAALSASRWQTGGQSRDAARRRVAHFLSEGAGGSHASDGDVKPGTERSSRGPLDARGTLRQRRLQQLAWWASPKQMQVPHAALYLNVAQHAFEAPRFFSWLHQRRDVTAVLLVHDLLPLDYPEYFRAGYRDRFEQRAKTIVEHAGALVTTSQAVAQRLSEEFARRGRPMVPTHVAALPSSLPATDRPQTATGALAEVPYFVILGTIEPRKNHLLLLNVWRRLAEQDAAPPKLLVLGSRGWENEQVVDMLDRSTVLRPHVREAPGLNDEDLRDVIAGARALLMPSFAEGYGLPVVEALSLGVPVVAADIPVFREVSQGKAILLDPLDGLGWLRTIQALSTGEGAQSEAARAAAQSFEAPTWDGYFASVRGFLDTL